MRALPRTPCPYSYSATKIGPAEPYGVDPEVVYDVCKKGTDVLVFMGGAERG